MAGIKNINVVSGTGNPVQMQDLQNLWSAINSLLRSTKTPISIIAGFATANNNTGTNIGEGIICYQGQAYYLPTNTAKIGQYLYANTIQDEQRVYEDGTTRYTYQDYVVNAADNASASGIGTLIGQATATNLASWKVGVLSDGSVTAAMLADGAVTTPKLANGAVTAAKIADGAVGSLQIGTEAIKNGNIQDGQITGSKLADQSIPGSKLSNKTITGTKIADKTITAGKIADATITAGQIAAETITNEEIANKTIIANQKLEDDSIEEAQYGTASVSTRALQANSVNTSIIKDGAVTGSKIADDAISGEKIEEGTIPESKISAPGVNYLKPTTVVPNAMLSNYKLNIIKIGNIGSTHVNAIMPMQQLPGTPVRIFIEHTFSESAVVDIKLSSVGAVAGTINITNVLTGMYAEIFVHDGRVFYWTSGDANYQME
jgi:hypothetical protein